MNIKKTLLTKRLITKNLTVFSKSGIPLTSSSNQDILQGGLLLAINSFVKESFDSELNQLKIGSHIIVFKHSQNLLGSIIFSDKENVDIREAEGILINLLCYLERMYPELGSDQIDAQKIEVLLNQYTPN